MGDSNKGKTKNPDILARRLLLKSLADIAKERLKDDIAKDIEQAEKNRKLFNRIWAEIKDLFNKFRRWRGLIQVKTNG